MSPNNTTRGSVMIAALVVTLVTGSLVGLFLKTVTQEIQNSYRFRMSFQAVNLAEAGLDFAIDTMRREAWNAGGWQKGSKGYYAANVPYVAYSWSGEVRRASVYIEPETVPARAIAEGYMRLRNGVEVRRQIRITLGEGRLGNKSLYANGVVSEDTVDFAGKNVYVDSYSSSHDILNLSQKYANRDNGSVATNSVIDSALGIGQATVYGRIATGGGMPQIGAQGSVTGKDTPTGVKVDMTRVARDFYAEFPLPAEPTLTSPETELAGSTMGTTGSTTHYRLSSLSIGGGSVVTVEGNVVLIVENDLKISGTGELKLAPNSSLKVYVRGSADVAGNGIANIAGKPKDLMIYGTGTTAGQEIKINGNGAFFGVIYAPKYAMSGRGGGTNGTMAGAVIAKSVKFTGNTNFHYDEDLASLSDDSVNQTNAKEIKSWAELTDASDRKNMASILTDGL